MLKKLNKMLKNLSSSIILKNEIDSACSGLEFYFFREKLAIQTAIRVAESSIEVENFRLRSVAHKKYFDEYQEKLSDLREIAKAKISNNAVNSLDFVPNLDFNIGSLDDFKIRVPHKNKEVEEKILNKIDFLLKERQSFLDSIRQDINKSTVFKEEVKKILCENKGCDLWELLL